MSDARCSRSSQSLLFVVGLAVLLSLSLPLWAQVSITGKITGVVTDQSGAAVPNATVTVKGPALMADRTTRTQADGSYLFDLLPPGTYTVTISAENFQTLEQTGIVINAGFTATANGKLRVGQIQQTVNVNAESVVDVQTVQTSTTFNQQLLQEIPAGRDPWSTVAQMPGATLDRFDVGGNQSMQQSTMQVHGSTPGEQVFSFNGLDLNWPGANGGYTQFYTNHDSFQEFQVVSDSTPSSVSISGIYMNMVTRSGSNTLHGSLAGYYGTAALQAGAKFPTFQGSPVRAGSPTVMVRDTTVSLGGPIIKDRWWLFGSYRRYDLRSIFLAVTDQNGNPIADPNHQTNTDLRSDWQLNSKNRLSFIWLYNEQNRFFRRDSALVSPEASWRQIEPAYILQALWTSQITNNLLLDVRAGYNKEVFPLGPQPGVTANDFNRTNVDTGEITGAAQSYFSNPAWLFKIAAGASWYKGSLAGSHNFKFGFEWGDNYNPYIQYVNQGINAFYNSNGPLQVTAFNTPFTAKSYFHDTSAYVQDAWTVRRRFTLNLGLRFDRFIGFYPEEKSDPNLVFPDLFPPTTVPASGNIVTWNNVSPRLGLAIDVTGRGTSVLRFSYGRFYKMEGTGLIETVNPIGFSSKTFKWGPFSPGCTQCDANNDQIPQTSEWKVGNPIAQSGGAVGTHIDPELSRPYSDSFSVSYEQQVWQDLRLGVSYYFRKKKNLFGTTNLAVTPSDYTAVTQYNDGTPIVNPLNNEPLTLYNLDPALVGAANFVVTNISALDDNSYHGVEFTAVKRLSHRWQVLGGFTIQRQRGAFGRGYSDDAYFDNFNDPNNDINRRDNYLNFDSTYVFKVDSTVELPWKFSASVNFQHYTGYPIQPTSFLGGDTFVDSSGNTQTKLNQGSEQIILQPAGRVRLPSINLLNLRLARDFKVRDRFTIKPLIDLFNLPNRQTVVSVTQTLPSTFGDPNSTYLLPTNTVNPFIARVGLKIDF
jgi:hypothetical protein